MMAPFYCIETCFHTTPNCTLYCIAPRKHNTGQSKATTKLFSFCIDVDEHKKNLEGRIEKEEEKKGERNKYILYSHFSHILLSCSIIIEEEI